MARRNVFGGRKYRSLARLVTTAALTAAFFAAPLLSPAAFAYPVDPNWAPPATVYIPETGQTLDRAFLELWRTGGSVFTYGFPISPEIEEVDGTIVQYFEYARFEYSPTPNADGTYVSIASIGAEMGAPLMTPRLSYRSSPVVRDNARVAKAWLPVGERDAAAKAAGEPSYYYAPETRHGTWGGFRAYWEATGGVSYLGNPVSEEYVVNGTNYQVFERGQLQWRQGEEVTQMPVGQVLAERYQISTTPQTQGEVPTYDEALFVPPRAVPSVANAPAAPNLDRSIVVSISQQAMWAYDGGQVVESTYVSTGRETFETPTGMFYVNSKLDSQTMEGVIGGESYNVPDVPFVMYFTDRGHAIHGAYWHDNFGNPMSHGCINLPLDMAAWLYSWAPMGMAVEIIP